MNQEISVANEDVPSKRSHGRPPPNDFTERARNSLPPFTPQPKRASGKALTFTRILAITCGFPTIRPNSVCFQRRRLSNVPTAYVHPAIEVKRRFRLSIEKATLIPDTLSHEKRTRTMRAALAACCVDHRALSCLRLPGALADEQL